MAPMKDRERKFLIMQYNEFPTTTRYTVTNPIEQWRYIGVCVGMCVCVCFFSRFKPAKQTFINIPLCFEA